MKRQNALEPAREGRLARTRFNAAFMSDTKWRKLIAAVRDSGEALDRVKLKFVDIDEPREIRFPPRLTCPHAYIDAIEFGPVELRAIEWIEMVGDWAERLYPIGRFPLEVRDGRTRIVGYANGGL